MTITASYIESEIRTICTGMPNVVAVISMGSCARGEETYFDNPQGEKELMSDYEMLIVVKQIAEVQDLNKKLQSFRDQIIMERHSENLDVEWSYKAINELKRLDKRFIFFEAKNSGKVINGDPEILSLFPQINITNLNYSELNTIIIHRLYHVVRGMVSKDIQYKKYLIARNSLDFASAFLPLAGQLIPSYEKRMQALEAIGGQYNIPQDLIKRHKNYLNMKKNYNSILYDTYNLEDMIEDFNKDMKLLADLQKKMQHGVLFKPDLRRIVSSVYRLNVKSLYVSLHWQKCLNSLYDKLMETLLKNDIDNKSLQGLMKEMNELFGYC